MAKLCKVPIEEQETIIQMSRDEDIAHVYSCDSRVIHSLDKKYARNREDFFNGLVWGVEYDIPQNLISIRKKPVQTKKRRITIPHKINFKVVKPLKEGVFGDISQSLGSFIPSENFTPLKPPSFALFTDTIIQRG